MTVTPIAQAARPDCADSAVSSSMSVRAAGRFINRVTSETLMLSQGLLERYHIVRNFLQLDSCVLCAARYTRREGLRLDKTILFPALRLVVERHAALGVCLAAEFSQQPSFSRLKTIDLSKVVEYCEMSNLEALMQVQFLRSFDTSADLPLWRLLVLSDNTVLFAWHHGIGDGLSGSVFHRTLLAALIDGSKAPGSSADPDSLVAIPTTSSFSPAIETVTSLTPSWSKVFREVYDLMAPTSWTTAASAWTGNPVVQEPTLKTNIRLLDFSSSEIRQFTELCRSHQTTLTSTFQTLALSILSGLITDEKFKTISAYIPVSLRGIAGTSPDVFCDHVSAYHIYAPIKPTFAWDDASELASVLRKQPTKAREEIGMLKFLFGRYEAYFKGKLGAKRQGSLELSNLGKIPITNDPTGAHWTIERMVFAQCDAATGSAIKLNMVGSPDGHVTIAVTWGEGAVSDSLAETFISRLQGGFRALLN